MTDMPEKNYTVTRNLNVTPEGYELTMCIHKSHTYITSKDKKEAVVEAINQFLIWYNKNK
jgi:hypothetical protein